VPLGRGVGRVGGRPVGACCGDWRIATTVCQRLNVFDHFPIAITFVTCLPSWEHRKRKRCATQCGALRVDAPRL
jgi:hypothetical protein